MKPRQQNGFTMIEVCIVVTLIGILATVAIPNFIRARIKSQENACIEHLVNIRNAIDTMALELRRNAQSQVEFEEVMPYLKGKVVCPSGGRTFYDSYALGTVDQAPACKRVASHTLDALTDLNPDRRRPGKGLHKGWDK